MPYLLKARIEPPHYVKFDCDFDPVFGTEDDTDVPEAYRPHMGEPQRRVLGTPWEFYQVPPRFFTARKLKRSPPDVMKHGQLWLVSERAKAVIDQVDPDRHNFFRVEMANGKRGQDGDFETTYFVLNPVGRGPFIDVETSKGAEWAPQPRPDGSRYLRINLRPELSFHGDKLEGRHLWYDERAGDNLFISDELGTALKEAGLKGFYFKSCETGAVEDY